MCSSLVRCRSPTCTSSIPGGMIPIFASEKPARSTSMNWVRVTISAPISSHASSRTLAISEVTLPYSAARSCLPSSSHFSRRASILPGTSQATISCHKAAARSLKETLLFLITSENGRNFSIKDRRAHSAAPWSASFPLFVFLVNGFSQAFLPRIPAAIR